MELQQCVKCGRGLKAPQGINTTGDPAIAINITVVSVGLRPRMRSRLQRSVFCMPCAAAISLAPPPEGAFNLTIYNALGELNEQSAAMITEARQQKINPRAPLRRMPGSKPDETLATPILHKPALLSAS